MENSVLIYEEKTSFSYYDTLTNLADYGHISCEAVKDIDLSGSSLVCGYSQYFSANNLYDY